MTHEELVQYITTRVRDYGTQKAAAQAWGISAVYLGDVLHGRRDAGPSLLEALGLRREVTYTDRENSG